MTLQEFLKAEPAIARDLLEFCHGQVTVVEVVTGYEEGEKVWYATLRTSLGNETWIVYSGGIWSF